MFKKSEESEWTRFSRALGSPPSAPEHAEREDHSTIEEPVTLAQTPPVEPEVYQSASAPPVSHEPEPAEEPLPRYNPSPPTVSSVLDQAVRPSTDLEQGETVVGDDANIEGTLRSDRSIRVRGSVQGEIESKQRVVVEESARVEARITAEHVTVLGEVNGSIDCNGRLEIAARARVVGEVTAGTLIIQEGAFFEGNLKMSSARDGATA